MSFGIPLSRRERQIMDVLFEHGRASAAEVMAALPDAPSYSAVRALLRVLEEKGHVRHVRRGKSYLYEPTHPRKSAARAALKQVLRTFFGGSVEQVVAALVSDADLQLSDEELKRLSRLIEEAKVDPPGDVSTKR
jgi:predicted transcriptional regulator